MPASPIRKLAPLADEARRRGLHIYHLNIGQPDLPTPEPMRKRLARVPEIFAYTPSGGTPEYLGVLSRYYARLGFELTDRELLATTGGSEALLFAFMTCADEGEEAIVVEPFYTNYSAFARMAGVRLVPLTSRAEDGFHLPPREAFEEVRTDKTRMVVLCNPNNPTGTVYTREELEMVASFCREHDLFLIADEVYREFVYDGKAAVSALSLSGMDDLVIVADSLSKRYSACGVRLGCLVTKNREVHGACLRMAQGRLSPPGLGQLAALGLLPRRQDRDGRPSRGLLRDARPRQERGPHRLCAQGGRPHRVGAHPRSRDRGLPAPRCEGLSAAGAPPRAGAPLAESATPARSASAPSPSPRCPTGG